MCRGNRKARIFEDDRDRIRFLRILDDAVRDCVVECPEHCLMSNHYHLLVHTPRGNISAFMTKVNGRFTQYRNRRHGWTGHVFGGRFTSPNIDDDVYLRAAMAYIARNPFDAGLVRKPELWRWSSYAATLGLRPSRSVSTKWLRRAFPARSLRQSRRLLRRAVLELTDEVPCEMPVAGSTTLKASIRELIGRTMYMWDLPRSYRALARPELKVILSAASRDERIAAIRRAYVVYAYKVSEIARCLAVHPTTVSRMLARARRTEKRRRNT
jgi:REP element-mobilizing transposase RayT